MGRFATELAVAVANVDGLHAKDIKNVSLWDALLPKQYTADATPISKQKKEPVQRVQSACAPPEYYDVRKDSRGRKVFVAHKAPCYGKGPSGKAGFQDVKKGEAGGANGNGKKETTKAGGDANGAGGAKGGSGDEEKKSEEWTTEEDEKLKALKAEGGPSGAWKAIATEMNRTVQDLKERWKVINPNTAGGDDNAKGKKDGNGGDGKKNKGGGKGGDKPKDEDKKPEETKKLTKAEKKAAKNEAKQAAAGGGDAAPAATGGGDDKKAAEKPAAKSSGKAPSKAASKAGSEARFTMGDWMLLQEDDLFSFGELQLLSELLNRDETLRWERIACQFYDKTGRRVHKDDIREKFECMGGHS